MKILAVWAVPRSLSTAFDRSMRERGDLTVATEPFSVTYYFSEERISERFGDRPPEPGHRFGEVLARLRASASRQPVLIKDMATHVLPWIDPEVGGEPDLLGSFRHTFLIRDPVLAIPSLVDRWPDADDAEAGFAAQHRLFDLVTSRLGKPPPVIDGEQLGDDPEAVLTAWCRSVDREFDPGQLSWEPRAFDGWQRWGSWFETVRSSRGFEPPTRSEHGHGAPPDPHTAALITRCRPHYQALRRQLISHDGARPPR